MMDVAVLSAGVFINLTYDVLKNGGAIMVPHLREKLKGWIFSDETATSLSELTGNIPQEVRADTTALTEYIQSSSLWNKVLADVKQENTQNKQETNIEGDLHNQFNFQGAILNNPTLNFDTKGQSTESEVAPAKKS
ncbi:hypothetical protein KIH87_17295 [Paraneptunicella aestuarii]|uniref:hypothetical protein n=1 Tax=Paraneptunicella aestuarii TaxID=2831148 RepID=UPI001E520C6A|nr:hypothetical protein [Paraneptunicella aestuarii]UAA38413.1 hypothetical protein KIH87_17295 [Paraneptunicella aestuarii]